MDESVARTGSVRFPHAVEASIVARNGSSIEMRLPRELDTALFAFNHEGKTAQVGVKNGIVEYTGDLPVGESARLLFGALAHLGYRP